MAALFIANYESFSVNELFSVVAHAEDAQICVRVFVRIMFGMYDHIKNSILLF